MLRIERRSEISSWRALLSLVVALAGAVLVGALLFTALGRSPAQGLALLFLEPIRSGPALAELAVKASPLLLIAVGLCLSFRANVWNIGAEGQFVIGAICSGGLAMRVPPDTGGWVVAPVLLLGVLGGALWAAIVALLRERYHANEILVSLMLVYVAEMALQYLVFGPWRDPQGYNFPQTITFPECTQPPRLALGQRADIGILLALACALLAWGFLSRSLGGFQLNVAGLAPAAARYAGFSARRTLWTTLLVSGALAGLAGGLEATGPVGQLNPYVPQGYGFAAIIVAFLARLHPAGAVPAAALMSMLYIGGELCQSRLGLPKALTGVFQGLLLLLLLGCDGVARYRFFWARPRAAAGS
ncbi:MAG: ABC transporter permease [Myxococcales bacterium]|nr:ABC transporter permease [Myxococcales bacterium]